MEDKSNGQRKMEEKGGQGSSRTVEPQRRRRRIYHLSYLERPNDAAKWFPLLFHIREVPGSYLGPNTCYSD
jgi:hypothetical protein